jgi:glycosyltransferase involved in cell wall biosynthesis
VDKSITRDIDLGDHLPIVVVYGNGRQDSTLACAQVFQALDKAQVDCVVLDGNTALPAMTRRQVVKGGTNLTERFPIEFSIVLPIYNEEAVLAVLHRRLTIVMAGLGEPYELIFVDDGSQDHSLELLQALQEQDPDHMRVIVLSRNFGHQQAVSAGLDYARGQAAIVMDADLQDPPEVIPQFVEKWRQGFQVVYAIREKRKEHFLKRSLYHAFYLILRSISKIDIPLEAGDFSLMDRCVLDSLTSLPERNRFMRGLRSWVGFKQIGLAYERDARFAGTTKYTFRKLGSLALDGLISFSYLPLRLATMLGFGVSALSFLVALYYILKKLTVGLQPPGFATLTVLILFLGGIQLITIGVIGEYIGQILSEAKDRPTYIVQRVFEIQRLREV